MIFFSYHFAIFCVVFFALYWLLAAPTVRRWIILCGCAVFEVYYAGPAGVAPIIVLATGTYFAGRSRNRRACIAWIVVCAAALIFYKYTYFLSGELIGAVYPALGQRVGSLAHEILPAAAPLAISFFTFEFVQYLIEVSRGRRPIASAQRFALFAIFWPTLVAGPIKRYHQFVPALASGVRNVDSADVYAGIIRVVVGILKKFIADNLTAWIGYGDSIYNVETVGYRWLFLAMLGARILLDFSGYSDMAIGFARLMGIRIPENFRWPYLARSINDFWHRWHISLSSWIRDYIYIPLGGNRYGPARRCFNALLAMSLCGLWHGASWNFILWGIYHGCGLIVNTTALRFVDRVPNALRSMVIWRVSGFVVGWAMTILFVHVGWLLFFYPVDRAWTMFLLLFTPQP